MTDLNILLTQIFRGIKTKEVIERSPKRVLFIDGVPPINNIQDLLDAGIQVVVRDHHWEETSRDKEKFEKVKSLLVENAIISTREEHPGCSSLVEIGEFSKEGDLVIADGDRDGTLSALKALGYHYPGMDDDCAILDGPWSEMTEENLTEFGFLFLRVWQTLPGFNPKNPGFLQDKKLEVAEKLAQAIQGNIQAKEWLEEKAKDYVKKVEAAKELAAKAEEIAHGVCLVDAGESQYDLPTLDKELFKKGFIIQVVRKPFGVIAEKYGGVQYYGGVDKKTGIDFQQIISPSIERSPENGLLTNTTFLFQCSQEQWEKNVLPSLKGLKLE